MTSMLLNVQMLYLDSYSFCDQLTSYLGFIMIIVLLVIKLLLYAAGIHGFLIKCHVYQVCYHNIIFSILISIDLQILVILYTCADTGHG